MTGSLWIVAGLVHLLATSVRAQVACENYGSPLNSSACACPPGFGGATCSAPACGGNIFQALQRPLVSGATATSFGNVSSSACACPAGWTGTGCNVCQASTVCQSAFFAAGGNTNGTVDSQQPGLNNTLTCNTKPRVWAAGEMSCSVINPTIQSLFPLSSRLTILRTLNTSLTPQPNSTSFAHSGSAYTQWWYDGIEQLYCAASGCEQSIQGSTGGVTWTCSGFKCTCRPGTAFCGTGKLDLTNTVDGLSGNVTISCNPLAADGTASCNFQQPVLQSVFSSTGLSLTGCNFGECVRQGVIDAGASADTSTSGSGSEPLSGGVIAGLAVVGAFIILALLGFLLGWLLQRKQRRLGAGYLGEGKAQHGGFAVEWSDVTYHIPQAKGGKIWPRSRVHDDAKVILEGISGRVEPGQLLAILGPSGAGKTTLIEVLANKNKAGYTSGSVRFPSDPSRTPRIGFVPQQDVLPAMLTVAEALLFAARLRLPEYVTDAEKRQRVEDVLEQLGLTHVRDSRIGEPVSHARGISGGEMRRVSIGLELVASPDVLILDEPTSGLDSVSALKVVSVLQALAHDTDNPTAVIATIHQPSSQIYRVFDRIVLLSDGRAMYEGAGGFAPAEYFAAQGSPCAPGYNVADHLLDLAHAPPVQRDTASLSKESTPAANGTVHDRGSALKKLAPPRCAAAFLTQLQVLSGREWKVLRRDKTFFLAHIVISALLGLFCGGLYFQTGDSIAGFQSRVGSLFFLGSLAAFSSLSALNNVLAARPLFVRERSNAYYSPTAWLFVRLLFDVIPLRIIPTIVVATITYWMAGLSPHPANFFKFLFILVLFTICMTLYNFLLGSALSDGGIAFLLSALFGLYQMTFAGFFVHLNSIPQVLRWLQWMCPLKYALEALTVNEVNSGLEIVDVLQGVPVSISASVIMHLLFGFDADNYYRDVLILFAFIDGFGISVIAVVWFWVRETR